MASSVPMVFGLVVSGLLLLSMLAATLAIIWVAARLTLMPRERAPSASPLPPQGHY